MKVLLLNLLDKLMEEKGHLLFLFDAESSNDVLLTELLVQLKKEYAIDLEKNVAGTFMLPDIESAARFVSFIFIFYSRLFILVDDVERVYTIYKYMKIYDVVKFTDFVLVNSPHLLDISFSLPEDYLILFNLDHSNILNVIKNVLRSYFASRNLMLLEKYLEQIKIV